MAYIIHENEVINLYPFVSEHGKNSYFCKVDDNTETKLLKFFNGDDDEIKEKISIVEKLINKNNNYDNAFPTDIIYVNDKASGYISKYYNNSINLMEPEVQNINFNLKLKSLCDLSKELKTLHKMGFINNDMRLSNNIISLDEQRGHLVDFEDMIDVDNFKNKCACYRFYKNYSQLPPSFKEDIKKHYICAISLLFNYDFESIGIASDIEGIKRKIKFDKDLCMITDLVFKGNGLLYFDQISNYFEDEERIENYAKKMKLG